MYNITKSKNLMFRIFMNEITKDVNFYESYFSGFNDVYEHNSVKDVALGIMKIFSYVTLGLPIIFAGAYYYKKSELDDMSKLCEKVNKAVDPIFIGLLPSQNELIQFLSIEVKDKNRNNFAEAFNKLSPSSQAKFFKLMDTQGLIDEAMKLAPKNLEEIKFDFKYSKGSHRNFSKATEFIAEFIDKLNEFDNLSKLSVDLSGIAYYTDKVKNLIESSVYFQNNNSKNLMHYQADRAEIGGGVRGPNNIQAVSVAVSGLLQQFKNNRSLKHVVISFDNIDIHLHKDQFDKIHIF